MHLAFSTTTDLVDRMEAGGLVERVRDQSDRRVVRIHLQEKGRAVIRDVINSRRTYLASKLSHFSPEQVEDLLSALKLLNREMKIDRE
jgi:DNA-binding MarR family transcriptional regulator